MDNSSPSFDIKTTTTDSPAPTPTPIQKYPVAFGPNVMAIPLHKSLVSHFGITEYTQIQEEVVEGVGILLRIVRLKCRRPRRKNE